MELYQYTSFTIHDGRLLLGGLGWTLLVFSVSMAAGILLGTICAMVRHARLRGLSQLVIFYVETFRNSPVLVQLFLVFYGLPILTGARLDPLTAALLTLSVNTGAFMTVIVRAALDAVPAGQWEAAAASGLRYRQIMRYIVLPQAARTIIPPTISLAVGQLQITALVSLINVVDLAKVGTILNMRTLRPFAVWPVIGLIYFALSKPLSLLAQRAELRLRPRGGWIR
jgi:polar amino acid transport system permease protein/polar amino acid transport system substrate-binding protein